jgi:hypothetical protein
METKALKAVNVAQTTIETVQPYLHGGSEAECAGLVAFEEYDFEARWCRSKETKDATHYRIVEGDCFPELKASIIEEMHDWVNRQ